MPVPFDRPMGPVVGKLLGMLDGTHQAGAIQTVVATAGRDGERLLTSIMELLVQYDCLMKSARPRRRSATDGCRSRKDKDTIHLGHAAVMYRQRDHFLLFDPWLLPWFAESNVPRLWGSLLPSRPRFS